MGLTMSSRFLRNKDLIDQALLDEVMVIGLGGIGSALVAPLAVMGFRCIVGLDPDILEEHNLSTTLYPQSFQGKTKAVAARTTARDFGCENAEMIPTRFNEGMQVSPLTIVCTDSMASRKTVWEAWSKLGERRAFVDIRMGALSIVVVTMTPGNDNYMDYWQTDESIADEPCTMKHTIFTAEVAAGIGINQLFAAMSNRFYHKKVWVGLQPISFECTELVAPNLAV